ncbi:MAG TPA: GPP34 family phosphoprotein, partial [Anaerolineales bacterium]|nr:GPP34 family phosphoprotein [Anaerolineales bacterium]
VLKNTEPTGDDLLDEAINDIHQVEKPHRPAYWISQFIAKKKKLREQLGIRLASQGYLHQEDKRFFWIFKEDEADNPMAPFKYQLKSDLRAKTLTTSANDAHSLALLKILTASGLLGLVFTADEHALATRTINEKVIRAALETPELQTIEEIGQGIAITIEDELD